MATKHIFIGIGGSGVSTVAELKYKVYEHTKSTELASRLEVMNSTHRFLFVDTDSKAINEANELYDKRYESGRIRLIESSDRLELGVINPTTAYEEALKDPDKEANRVIISSCSQSTFPLLQKQSLTDGAGMLRLSSRIAFIRNAERFYSMIEAAIQELKSVGGADNNTTEIKYWVVSSSCGGTGSGIVNDVLYYVNMAAQLQGTVGYPNVALVLYMPKLYMTKHASSDHYANNAFALFKELETISSWSGNTSTTATNIHAFTYTLDGKIRRDLPFRPFRFCIPVDFRDEESLDFADVNEMYSTTAEMLNYIHHGSGAMGLQSILSNTDMECAKRGIPYVLIPMGYAALRKPEEQFDNYMTLRLRYEVLRYGLLGNGINPKDCHVEVINLVKDIVRLSGYYRTNSDLDDYLSENLNETKIKDNRGRTIVTLRGELYVGQQNEVLREFQKVLELEYGDQDTRKKEAINEIEKHILRWVENNARMHGLLYVQKVLSELDDILEKLYTAFMAAKNGNKYKSLLSEIPGLGLAGDCLETLKEGLANLDLQSLANEAYDVTIPERLGRNGDDVEAFLEGLRNWVKQSVGISSSEETFDIIRILSVGDNGVLDHVKNHVADLVDASGFGRAEEDYKKLARSFYCMSVNARTHYIPDITTFSDGGRWNNDHLFSNLYASIITPESYDPETGLPIPERKSIEHLFAEAIRKHEELKLDENGYYDKDGSRFFINDRKSGHVVVEEILGYINKTFKEVMESSLQIQSEWFVKRIDDFIVNNMSNAERTNLRDKNKATVFLPFSKQRNLNLITRAIRVAPAGTISDSVFTDTDNEQRVNSADPSEMYRIIAKIGLPFDAYDYYADQQLRYENSTQKEIYHFHRNFADASIRIPKMVSPEMVSFVRYLLMDKMKDYYKGVLVHGTGSYNKDNYADSPIIVNGNEVRFASENALSMNDANDHIELAAVNYSSITIDAIERRYLTMFDRFITFHNTMNYGKFISRFIAEINVLKPGLITQKYAETRKALFNELDQLCAQAKAQENRSEQELLVELLSLLDNQLKTVEQFVG